MVDLEHLSRLLEDLRTEIIDLQLQSNGTSDHLGERLATTRVHLTTILAELHQAQQTDRKSDRRLALHYAVSHALLTATDMDEVAPQILQAISEYLGWSYGAFWRVNEKRNLIACQAVWHIPTLAHTTFIRQTLEAAFRPGEGLPGEVWQTGEPTWRAEISARSHFPRQASAGEIGLHSALAFPVRGGSQILGVIEFFAPEIHAPDLDVLQTLAVIGNQIGQFLERQQVQAELTLTQSHLDLILEQMPAAVIIAEAPSGRLLLGNAQVEKIWRHPFLRSSSISDYEAWQGFHLDGAPYQAEEWPLARAITTGEVVIGEEVVLLRGDGTRGVARISAAPVRDADDRIIAGVVVFDDITAEHQAIERVLRLQAISTALLQAVTPTQVADEVLKQAIVALDAYAGSLALLKADERTVYLIGSSGYPSSMSDQFEEMPLELQMPLPAAIRTGEAIFIEDPAQAADRFPELLQLIAQTGTQALAAIPLRVEDRVIGAIGISFRQPRVFEPEDRTFMLTLAGQCALALDRARLYAAEHEARQRAEAAQRRLAFLAEASHVLASSLDYETTLAHVARLALPELADWSLVWLIEPEGCLKTVAITHVIPENEDLIREYLRRYPIDPEGPTGIAAVVRSGQSELIAAMPPEDLAGLNLASHQRALLQAIGMSAYMCVPLSTQQEVVGAISFGMGQSRRYTQEDIALAEELGRRCAVAIQNARLYHQAQQAIRVRDEFLTMASHELRTPVTALLGMSNLLDQRLSRKTATGEQLQRGVSIIAQQATRLKRLLEQMFDLSRVELNHFDLNIQEFDLSRVVRQVVEESRALLQRHTIDVDCPESLLMEGDEDRLEQVLQNLVYNAIKYSPDGGTIAVRVAPDEQTVAISISDPGIGIPEVAREHIFKRFYRADNISHRNISGLGVGLYIVNEIITRHAGTISFSSVEGRGTTFNISLPRRARQAAHGT